MCAKLAGLLNRQSKLKVVGGLRRGASAAGRSKMTRHRAQPTAKKICSDAATFRRERIAAETGSSRSERMHAAYAAASSRRIEASKSVKRSPCTTTCSRKSRAAPSPSKARIAAIMASCSDSEDVMRWRTRSCRRR